MYAKYRKIALATLGGTITMTPASHGGVASTLSAQDLVQSVPGLAALDLSLRVHTLANVASGAITFEQLFAFLAWAKQQIEEGAQSVVLVQGTDTLEETAFFLDLYWPYVAPLVITGAMRSPTQAGADGPANVLAALRVASCPDAKGYGALVVMNDDIHQARFVRKSHSTAMHAFSSPVVGPVGALHEEEVVFFRSAPDRFIFPIPQNSDAQVLLLENTLDESLLIYQALPTMGYQGLVLAGVGSGHVSSAVRKALSVVCQHMPVLMASRTGAGSTTAHTYGYVGGEIDLQTMGVVMTGSLCPRKARLLLLAMLWDGMDRHKQKEHMRNFLSHFYTAPLRGYGR